MKRGLSKKHSGNEVCYANSSKLIVNNMLYGQLHCQKGFDLIIFSYENVHVLSERGLGGVPKCPNPGLRVKGRGV
jgi:hypothetical protein